MERGRESVWPRPLPSLSLRSKAMQIELNARTRSLWLAGAMVMGVLSQWCMAFGPCGAPI